MKMKILVGMLMVVLLVGNVLAVEIVPPPAPGEEVGGATSIEETNSKAGVPVYRIPDAGSVPVSDFGNYYEKKDGKFVPRQGVSYDRNTRTWTDKDNNKVRYADDVGAKVQTLTAGSFDVYLWRDSGYERIQARRIEYFDQIELNGLTKIEGREYYYGDNVRRVYNPDEYTEYHNYGDRGGWGKTKDVYYEGNVVRTVSYTDGDIGNADVYDPKPQSVILNFRGQNTNKMIVRADNDGGDVVVEYQDGSSDRWAGSAGTFVYNSEYPYSFGHDAELGGERTIHFNPNTGETYVQEDIGNDFYIYDRDGNLLAESPYRSGEIEDVVEGGGSTQNYVKENGFGGDYVAYYEENGGVDEFITLPEVAYDEVDGKQVPKGIEPSANGGYRFDLGINSFEDGGETYELGQGGDYRRRGGDGKLYTISAEKQRQLKQNVEEEKYLKAQKKNNEGDFVDVDSDDPDFQKTKAQAKAISYVGRLFAGLTEFAKIGMYLNAIKPKRQAISNALFGDAWLNEWRETVDQHFAENYLGVKYWASEICKQKVRQVESDGVALVGTPDVEQFVGRVEATKSEPVPVICDTDVYCRRKTQNPSAECEGNICKVAGQEVPARFYKITFHVAAPSDLDFTPYKTEDDAVTFNIVLIGPQKSSSLFKEFISLNNGQISDQIEGVFSLVMDYAPYDYDRVCIVFGISPVSIRSGPREPIGEICNNIATTEQSINNVLASDSTGAVGGGSGSGGSGGAGGVMSNDWSGG